MGLYKCCIIIIIKRRAGWSRRNDLDLPEDIVDKSHGIREKTRLAGDAGKGWKTVDRDLYGQNGTNQYYEQQRQDRNNSIYQSKPGVIVTSEKNAETGIQNMGGIFSTFR